MPKWELQKVTFGKLKAELFKSDCHPTHPYHIDRGEFGNELHRKSPALIMHLSVFPRVRREHGQVRGAANASSTIP